MLGGDAIQDQEQAPGSSPITDILKSPMAKAVLAGIAAMVVKGMMNPSRRHKRKPILQRKWEAQKTGARPYTDAPSSPLLMRPTTLPSLCRRANRMAPPRRPGEPGLFPLTDVLRTPPRPPPPVHPLASMAAEDHP